MLGSGLGLAAHQYSIRLLQELFFVLLWYVFVHAL